ncbi:MAG: PLP-dependent aspartate aminotransferase family protein [Myxococcota bacterium]|nr:PLP-dependent aspartate aminotransferase family protein [Myxococcota bacterium]
MTDDPKFRPATRAVHAGSRISTNDVISTVPPIYQSASFYYPKMSDLDGVFGETRSGYCYTRYGNPTVVAFEEAVTELEGGETGLAFASGMAAIHAALIAAGVYQSPRSVVAGRDLYGATYVLLDQLMRSQGIDVHFVDATDVDAVAAACAAHRPAAVLVESISNPLLKVTDIASLAKIVKSHGACLLVDATFATPILSRPLSSGADMVIHSATKYLGGHGDVLGGVVVTSAAHKQELQRIMKALGANLGPHEAWLLLRGLRTLALRMEAHCQNALTVATRLTHHPRIERVIYPGLPSHPQHDLATRVFDGQRYGGMVAFEIKGAGQTEVFQFFEGLELCVPATTLGDVTTLVLYPAHSSHRGLSPLDRSKLDISEGLVRMSVGIEAVDDIFSDINQSLERL